MFRAFFLAVLTTGLFIACSSSETTSSGTSDAGSDDAAVEDVVAEDTAVNVCKVDAGNSCANCESTNCCEEKTACLSDTACAQQRQELDDCIASTEAGTSDRHACFQSFEGKSKKAQTLHFCGEKYCRAKPACDIP